MKKITSFRRIILSVLLASCAGDKIILQAMTIPATCIATQVLTAVEYAQAATALVAIYKFFADLKITEELNLCRYFRYGIIPEEKTALNKISNTHYTFSHEGTNEALKKELATQPAVLDALAKEFNISITCTDSKTLIDFNGKTAVDLLSYGIQCVNEGISFKDLKVEPVLGHTTQGPCIAFRVDNTRSIATFIPFNTTKDIIESMGGFSLSTRASMAQTALNVGLRIAYHIGLVIKQSIHLIAFQNKQALEFDQKIQSSDAAARGYKAAVKSIIADLFTLYSHASITEQQAALIRLNNTKLGGSMGAKFAALLHPFNSYWFNSDGSLKNLIRTPNVFDKTEEFLLYFISGYTKNAQEYKSFVSELRKEGIISESVSQQLLQRGYQSWPTLTLQRGWEAFVQGLGFGSSGVSPEAVQKVQRQADFFSVVNACDASKAAADISSARKELQKAKTIVDANNQRTQIQGSNSTTDQQFANMMDSLYNQARDYFRTRQNKPKNTATTQPVINTDSSITIVLTPVQVETPAITLNTAQCTTNTAPNISEIKPSDIQTPRLPEDGLIQQPPPGPCITDTPLPTPGPCVNDIPIPMVDSCINDIPDGEKLLEMLGIKIGNTVSMPGPEDLGSEIAEPSIPEENKVEPVTVGEEETASEEKVKSKEKPRGLTPEKAQELIDESFKKEKMALDAAAAAYTHQIQEERLSADVLDDLRQRHEQNMENIRQSYARQRNKLIDTARLHQTPKLTKEELNRIELDTIIDTIDIQDIPQGLASSSDLVKELVKKFKDRVDVDDNSNAMKKIARAINNPNDYEYIVQARSAVAELIVADYFEKMGSKVLELGKVDNIPITFEPKFGRTQLEWDIVLEKLYVEVKTGTWMEYESFAALAEKYDLPISNIDELTQVHQKKLSELMKPYPKELRDNIMEIKKSLDNFLLQDRLAKYRNRTFTIYSFNQVKPTMAQWFKYHDIKIISRGLK